MTDSLHSLCVCVCVCVVVVVAAVQLLSRVWLFVTPWTCQVPLSMGFSRQEYWNDWYSHYGKWYGDSLKKLGIKPPYDPAIPLLGIYPEETKIERDICIPLFIAALFTKARTWKQPRYPSKDEWIKKLWYITMEYYSAIKRNAFESVPMRWMNLEPTSWVKWIRKRKINTIF